MNVLIVGAGPTGLTAAIELARRGVTPMVIDRRSNASTLSRAVGITPRSLKLLSYSGASDALIAEGVAMDGLRVYFGQKLSLAMDLRSETAFYPSLLCLAQDRTEAILADTLNGFGCAIRYGVQLVSLSETLDGVVAEFDNGDVLTFDQVIGADGIGSTVRQQAGVGYPGIDLENKWAIADVDLDDWRHPGCLTVVQAGPGRVAVIVPIGDARYRIVASHDNALEAMPLPHKVANIRREGAFAISVRMAETYPTGRIHFAGDAAHCHSPVGGRGMNLGIGDAVELARRMTDGRLDGYSSTRHSEALKARAITERGRKMSTSSNIARRVAFRALVSAARISPYLRRRLGEFIVDF